MVVADGAAVATSSSKLTDLVTDLAVKLEKACDPAKMVCACGGDGDGGDFDCWGLGWW
jgi:hypothetical protein